MRLQSLRLLDKDFFFVVAVVFQAPVCEREASSTAVRLSSPCFPLKRKEKKNLATLPQANWITAAYHRQRQVFSEYKTFVLLPSRDSVKAPNLIPQQQNVIKDLLLCLLSQGEPQYTN